MGVIITIVIVLVVAGSIMWLKPSASQQRQARLRLLARQLGLDVRLSALPQTRRARVRREHPSQGVAYRLLRFGKNAYPLEFSICRADAQSEWESESETPLPPALQAEVVRILPQLPSDAVAFEITAHGCGVYWRERGDEETVRLLQRLLKDVDQVLGA